MSFLGTVLLGAFAGLTIFIGLPFGRMQMLSARARVALAMFAVGVLAFLFVDVFEHAFEIVEDAMTSWMDGDEGAGRVIGLFALLAAAVAAGPLGLAFAERLLRPADPAQPPIAGGATDTMAADDLLRIELATDAGRRRALRTGMTIAAAIGLHNFAEGLAIGVSASAGEIGLATVLIIGFALHNATEGFGILGPLGAVRPTWRWLLVAGLIGGGPTFLGTMLGYSVASEPLELAFYALAGGAILYVIGEVWNGVRRYGHKELGVALLSLGFVAGILTDLIVVYGGG